MKNLLKLSPADFCAATGACQEGRDFALTQTDMAAVWHNCPRVAWLLWMADKVGQKPDDKTLRLFAVWCVRETPLKDGRKVFDLLTDERSKNALLVAERFAHGKATINELDAARDAAGDAARDAIWTAARAAARAAEHTAWDASRAAGWADVEDGASWNAAMAAAQSAQFAAWADAGSAALDAASRHQANHFRTLMPIRFAM